MEPTTQSSKRQSPAKPIPTNAGKKTSKKAVKQVKTADQIIAGTGVILFTPEQAAELKEKEKTGVPAVVVNIATDFEPHPFVLSAKTCVEILTKAGLDRRASFRNELAVGLGVLHEAGGTNKEAKALLTAVYARSGYDCMDRTGGDYKTVNRRVNVTATFFDTLGAEKIGQFIGEAQEADLVMNIANNLEPMELYSVDHVLAFCGKPRANGQAQADDKGDGKGAEDGDKGTEKGAEGANKDQDQAQGAEGKTDGKEEDAKSKEEEKPTGPAPLRIAAGRVRVEVPGDVTPQELMDLAFKIMAKARTLTAQTVEHKDVKKEEETTPQA